MPQGQHRSIDKRLDRGDHAQQIARDLWFQLRLYLTPPTQPESLRASQINSQFAANVTCQLVYLAQHYDIDAQGDRFQGLSAKEGR